MNSTYLFMGALVAAITALLGAITGDYSPSPYGAAIIVLLAMALASRK